MRIGFDMDGVIASGEHLEQPERAYDTYMKLDPMSKDIHKYWKQVLQAHECYIITARSFPDALDSVLDWLNIEGLALPRGIITAVNQIDKCAIAMAMNLDMHFDDSPTVANCFWGLPLDNGAFGFVDNPAWPRNQAWQNHPRLRSWKEIFERINAEQLHQSETALQLRPLCGVGPNGANTGQDLVVTPSGSMA